MKIRVGAIITGLAVDFLGSTAFVVAAFGIASIVLGHLGRVDIAVSTRTVIIVCYWIGLAFTLFGAYVTAALSKPNCVLNSLVFGLLSTIPCLFFVSRYPVWFTVLCVLTILSVSIAVGCAVAARTV